MIAYKTANQTTQKQVVSFEWKRNLNLIGNVEQIV